MISLFDQMDHNSLLRLAAAFSCTMQQMETFFIPLRVTKILSTVWRIQGTGSDLLPAEPTKPSLSGRIR
ncbi:hypothetical protein CBR_g970 [Chara braunii]|uniref:Uncharacterized protein n=1 Tax=Chara braunii TaxID=69332 RepID=A0A388KCT5_CHABU|nr:hypothetical protein CBR_g970 [Chara braunii]|eukprot:GBG67849.1 hypothetical protein CBR_g970 [Chara braunii]